MRVSVIQMNAGHDKARNIAQARSLMDGAIAADRPSIVALPEMWTSLGGDRASKFAAAEALPPIGSNEPGGEAYEFLRGIAREHRIHVHGGSLAERAGETLFNTTVVFDPSGRELARYRKVHLFDIATPDGTGYRESATFGSGGEIVTYEAGGVKVGCAICYDVRFPELFLALRRAGAELSGAKRATYGHSLVCDPWGHVVAKVSDGIGWTTARIDPAITAKVRRDMPVLDHRKLA